jgi:hypothetical protein
MTGGSLSDKEVTVVFYGRRFPRQDWRVDLDQSAMERLLSDLGERMRMAFSRSP